MTPPRITIEYDLDSDRWSLMATSYSRTTPAGPRLFRAPPWPAIAFEHADEAAAQKDARTLQNYLDGVYARRGPSRAKVRAMGEDGVPEIREAVWNL